VTSTPRSDVATRARVAVLLGIGGGAGLLATSRPWVVLSAEVGLTSTTVQVTGSALAPLASAAAVVALAGVLAVLVARSWGRRVVGLLVVVVSGAGLAQVVAVLADRVGRARSWWAVEVGAAAGTATSSTTPWAVVAAVSLLLVVVAGVLVLVRAGAWGGLPGRYETPGAASPTSDPWRALDEGEDPTVEDGRGP
jgi:uncharacterized membrane protein (TIGR02234 family)